MKPRFGNGPTTLYRFFDRDDVLLYVGISAHPVQRLDSHGLEKDWWLHVVRATFEHHSTRTLALAAEGAAILAECPVFNVAGNPNPNAYPEWEQVQQEHAMAEARRLSLGDRF